MDEKNNAPSNRHITITRVSTPKVIRYRHDQDAFDWCFYSFCICLTVVIMCVIIPIIVLQLRFCRQNVRYLCISDRIGWKKKATFIHTHSDWKHSTEFENSFVVAEIPQKEEFEEKINFVQKLGMGNFDPIDDTINAKKSDQNLFECSVHSSFAITKTSDPPTDSLDDQFENFWSYDRHENQVKQEIVGGNRFRRNKRKRLHRQYLSPKDQRYVKYEQHGSNTVFYWGSNNFSKTTSSNNYTEKVMNMNKTNEAIKRQLRTDVTCKDCDSLAFRSSRKLTDILKSSSTTSNNIYAVNDDLPFSIRSKDDYQNTVHVRKTSSEKASDCCQGSSSNSRSVTKHPDLVRGAIRVINNIHRKAKEIDQVPAETIRIFGKCTTSIGCSTVYECEDEAWSFPVASNKIHATVPYSVNKTSGKFPFWWSCKPRCTKDSTNNCCSISCYTLRPHNAKPNVVCQNNCKNKKDCPCRNKNFHRKQFRHLVSSKTKTAIKTTEDTSNSIYQVTEITN